MRPEFTYRKSILRLGQTIALSLVKALNVIRTAWAQVDLTR